MEEKEPTVEQAAYQNWLMFPPHFYCRKYTDAELPPENAKGWYCGKQCPECIAEVKNRNQKSNK